MSDEATIVGEDDDRLYESTELMGMEIYREPWIIPGVLTRADKVVIFAEPGIGKSILVQQLASCAVGGHAFLGHAVADGWEEARVLFIAGEGDLVELQGRGQRMARTLPIPTDSLYYWPTPLYPMNTREGLQRLLEFVAAVVPTLIILDPIYSLFAGSMKEDEAAGDFLRNMNRVQALTGAAVVLTHHTHRPVKADGGGFVDEEDSYFGSMLWKAWARQMWSMRRDGPELHSVELRVTKDRNNVNEMGTKGKSRLMLVEPEPLLFVPREKGWGPAAHTVLEALRSEAMTRTELESVTRYSSTTVSAAIKALGSAVGGDGGWPERYRSV